MKSYKAFINEKLSLQQNTYKNNILTYLKKDTTLKYYEYEEEFIVKKQDSNKELTGKLYLVIDEDKNNRAIRFNFDNNQLVSIDSWNHFEFREDKLTNKPDYNMNLEGAYVLKILPNVLNFVKGDFELKEYNNIEGELINNSPNEEVKLKSIEINKNVFEQDIDVFEAIKLYTAQVAYKMSNSLVITGLPGLGKSTEVENTLEEIRAEYVKYSGDASVAGLYEALFLHRNELILLDDIDAIFDDKASIDILKAVLDTKEKREVSRAMKTYFTSDGMSDKEIWEEYLRTKKMPKKFTFTGRIIFITNLPGESLDKAIMSRSLYVDINPSKEEIIKRMYNIMPKVQPNVSIDKKREVIEFMVAMDEAYTMTFPLNLRTFVHCLNIRLANDFKMTINGESVFAFQMLIKQFLVKK